LKGAPPFLSPEQPSLSLSERDKFFFFKKNEREEGFNNDGRKYKHAKYIDNKKKDGVIFKF
jgi:hypothetical protein